jgi:outer membrane protein assembly factor BamB
MIRFRFCLLFIVLLTTLGCGPRASKVDTITAEASGIEIKDLTISVDSSSDWPWWRGPNGNGISNSESAPVQWSDSTGVLWRSEIPGRGHSSPTVVGNQIFLATALDAEQQQMIVAYDRGSGQEAWRTVVHQGGFPSPNQLHRKGTNANGTVACDGVRVYCAFLNRDSIISSALDLTGKIVWQQEIGKFNSKFGYAPSPLFFKSLVVFAGDNQGGGYLAALDRDSGEIVWRNSRPAIATYSSPAIANVAGRDQLLISGCNQVSSYDPSSGESLWSCPGTAEASCGTVVWDKERVFASGGYPDRNTLCVAADGSAKAIWSNSTKLYEPSLILVGEYLYGVTDDGIGLCWEASSGKELWKERLGGNFSASPVFCAGHIYVSSDDGHTTVFRSNPQAFELVAKNKLGDDTYASPTICGGQIFLRVGTRSANSRQEYLICVGQ